MLCAVFLLQLVYRDSAVWRHEPNDLFFFFYSFYDTLEGVFVLFSPALSAVYLPPCIYCVTACFPSELDVEDLLIFV